MMCIKNPEKNAACKTFVDILVGNTLIRKVQHAGTLVPKYKSLSKRPWHQDRP